MFIKKNEDDSELKQSNYGRIYGWFIEHRAKRIGELNYYEYDDMFWDRYTIIPYEGYEAFLFNFENWLKHDFQYRNKLYQQCAKNAVFGMDGIHKEDNKHTIIMRGLYVLSFSQSVMDVDKKCLKEKYGKLYFQISEILFRHDPMEINFGKNTDEYNLGVNTILPRLNGASSEKDVHNIIYEEFVRWFSYGDDKHIAGSKDKYAYKKSAKEIWKAWKAYSKAKDKKQVSKRSHFPFNIIAIIKKLVPFILL